METIGKRIHHLRKKSLLSMSKLGDKIGTKSSAISNWENERKQPSAKMIISLSEFFNVSTDWLLKGEDANPHFYNKNGNLLTVEEEKKVDSYSTDNEHLYYDPKKTLTKKILFLLKNEFKMEITCPDLIEKISHFSEMIIDGIQKEKKDGTLLLVSKEELEFIQIIRKLKKRDVTEMLLIAQMKDELNNEMNH
ncbi:helix-turn-helix domain-containing protein [Bacillus sp. FJAT-50079]|uniref:helix-turn-helix domain-containing protein n=1 Tax=Bacillus sp. FJAT-50079 TaxID=2833577 RepID=UPI001BC91FF9|nr:helix-turn-helix domain-containing protein [Bacillus sp. FJAT-50079]